MDIGTAVAVGSMLVTVLGGFARILRRMTKLELQIETMWTAFLEPTELTPRRGRRRIDFPILRPGRPDASPGNKPDA